MTQINIKTAIEMIYRQLGMDLDNVDNDAEHNLLTVNTGRTGREAVWYLDFIGNESAVYTDTLQFLAREEIEAEFC